MVSDFYESKRTSYSDNFATKNPEILNMLKTKLISLLKDQLVDESVYLAPVKLKSKRRGTLLGQMGITLSGSASDYEINIDFSTSNIHLKGLSRDSTAPQAQTKVSLKR
jgi:hypothetical protein